LNLKSRTKGLERGLEKLSSKDHGGTCPRCGKPEGPADLGASEGAEIIRAWLQAKAALELAGEETQDFEAYYLERFCGCEGREAQGERSNP